MLNMKRREFITLLGGAAAAWPRAARAQQPTKIARIGFLGPAPASAYQPRVEALWAGLRDLGYVEGKNITIEYRWAENVEQLPEFVAELIRMNVDIIFASSSTYVEPARQATKTIPIVFAIHADPVGISHVASLSRPGGNITGLTMLLTDLAAKELEILKEAVPHAVRIGIVWNPTTPSHSAALPSVKAAGEKLGIALQMESVSRVEEFNRAFLTMTRERVDGILVVASAFFFPARAARGTRTEASAARDVWHQGERGGRWSHELRRRSQRPASARCDLRGQNPQRHQAGRPTRRASV
jgi:putative tryptophan/tyrosine transport system substrate-binding protein